MPSEVGRYCTMTCHSLVDIHVAGKLQLSLGCRAVQQRAAGALTQRGEKGQCLGIASASGHVVRKTPLGRSNGSLQCLDKN